MSRATSPTKCVPCEGGATSGLICFSREEAEAALSELPDWKLKESDQGVLQIRKAFIARNFTKAVEFFNELARIAEEEGHHPDFHLTGYRNVEVVLWTHSMSGLTQNDFAVAKRLDTIPISYSKAQAACVKPPIT